MQEEIANLVHPIFSYGLKLRDRLEAGESPRIDVEQAALRSLLLTDLEAQRWSDFGGEEPPNRRSQATGGEDNPAPAHFLGARYALTCWLDELFILSSRWGEQWNESKLEVALYGSNERAWRFWEQAAIAERRSSTDALEVIFLCAMLGFRGELREAQDKLQMWVTTNQARLTRRGAEDWPHPPELEPPTNVPPLHAREGFQRVVWMCGAVFLVLIPVVAFFVVQQLGR
jgi:type VI secretion system protein ImpK